MNNFMAEIKKGIEFLYEEQTIDGNFPDNIYYIRQAKWNTAPATIFSTSIVTHSVLNILSIGLENDDIESKCRIMLKKAQDFFISEMEMPGLWRFGMRSDERWNKLPYDTDDTCCVSYLLKNYHPYIYFGMNKQLILRNRNDEGLFFTWILPLNSNAQNDNDLVVNVNALLYLGENEKTKNLINHICSLVNSDSELLSIYYYCDILCLYYMISRAYNAGVRGLSKCKDAIIERILYRESNNILYSAMALCTLSNLNHSGSYPSELIFNLLDNQNGDGCWDKYPLYQGEVFPNPPAVLFGSKALTTAICLEALSSLVMENR